MDEGLNILKEFLRQNVDYSNNVEKAKDYFYYLKGSVSLLNIYLEPHEYSYALTLLCFYGRRAGLVDESLAFIDKEYKTYCSRVKYDYSNKSTFFFQWATLLEAKGLNQEALEKVKKATLYNLTDNVSYTNYEFLSFRGCTKYVLSEIADETISLMHPSEFNDPMDTVMLKWLDNQIESGAAGFETQKEALKNLRVRCFSRVTDLPRGNSVEDVLKLSRKKKQDVCRINPLMWTHYADEHKGICIKYRLTSEQLPLHNADETELFRIGKIDYKPKFSVNELEISVWDALFAKSKVWQYERETRLIYYSTNDVPRVKTVHVPGAISGIYLGLRCSGEDERIIKALVKDRNIPIYRMYTDCNNVYKLKAKEII